jgi:hypothetical protein
MRTLSLSIKKHSPGRSAMMDGRPPGHAISTRSDYGFGAADAAEAASAAALAAAAESAAAEAAESAAAGGGVVSVVGAGASVLLPQAESASAATKALNASLVFILSIPQKYLMIKRVGQAVLMGFRPYLRADFRVFQLTFISLSPVRDGLYLRNRSVG